MSQPPSSPHWFVDPMSAARPSPGPAPAPPHPGPQPAPPRGRSLLPLLGGLTAAHLYHTYLNLGLLADAVEKEVYTTAQGKKLLDEINGLVDTVERQLAQLPPAVLKPEERKALERVRTITAQLRTQA